MAFLLKDHLAGIRHNNEYRPSFFRLNYEEDKKSLSALLSSNINVVIHNPIYGQLKELVKSQNPTRKLSPSDFDILIHEHLNGVDMDEYGVWVYYPWLNKLVHILDEKEFIEVRTNRNKHKITSQEQLELYKKKIGVIGLSVGQSVSLSLAMERSFGELRIADYDILELSNYNRIRTRIDNMDLLKTTSVAREIMEIDPFLNIKTYDQGINEDNIDDFLIGDGKLDVLIDECDSLHIKLLARLKAKKYQIPVLMDTSDRGMIDVERFDLEPNRDVFHGFVNHISEEEFLATKNMTNEQKIPIMLPILGLNTMSTRLKASLVEVEQSITTWPQLASSVIMGGGMTADVCRRILLDYYHESGRYFIDIEQLIGDVNSSKKSPINDNFDVYTSSTSIDFRKYFDLSDKYLQYCSPDHLHVSDDHITQIVNAGSRGPSGGNNQPWKWIHTKNGQLLLMYDKSRTKSFIEFDDMGAIIGIGSAGENALLKAQSLGYSVELAYLPLGVDDPLKILFTFYNKPTPKSVSNTYSYLNTYINDRVTNRIVEPKREISNEVLNQLKQAAESIDHVSMQIITDEKLISVLANIVSSTDRLRLLEPQGHHDVFNNEIRWTKEENELKKDGIDIATVGLTPSEIAGFEVVKDPEVLKLIKQWDLGNSFRKLTGKTVLSAGAMCLLTIPKYDSAQWLDAGRSLERVWLKACELNVTLLPLCVPILFFNRLKKGNGENLSPYTKHELTKLYDQYQTVFSGLKTEYEDAVLFRLAYTDAKPVRTKRLDLEEILYFEHK